MRLLSSAVVAALALAVPAMAQDAPAKKPKATYNKKDTKTVTAKVKSIDVATRHVVLTTPDGQDHEFVVGKQARNLPQVKVGDDGLVQYQEALALERNAEHPANPLPQPTEPIPPEPSDADQTR